MIQRTIHQLWVGPKPLPQREEKWCHTMELLNPTWTHRLHGNELLTRYADDPYVKHLQIRKAPLAFLSDRLRMLLLRDEGGIYIDVDAEPIRPLDTLKFWDRKELDFVYGLRNPYRPGVALHRGIAVADNSVLASARGGVMVEKILNLWRPEEVEVAGQRVGLGLISHTDENCICLNFRSFYDMAVTTETVLLHDAHNLGSWTTDHRVLPVAKTGETIHLNATL